ncbi:hypothetical protein JCM8202_000278 [Rhodotorula sphaerocarpa]
MGVRKLWEEVEAGVRITTWSQLVESAAARPRIRGLRVGVDVAQWMMHSRTMVSQTDPDTGLPVNLGPNADLRSLYYRACKMLADGVLACFVFDGPRRPAFKRDHRINSHYVSGLERDLVKMLDVLGMEWRKAPGEAEAELAAMQSRGEIDAVLTDDVDVLLFGSPTLTVIRNPSKNLSANMSKKAQQRTASSQAAPDSPSSSPPTPADAGYPPVDPSHEKAIVTYSNAEILAQTGLGKDELILVALLVGGDYDTAGSVRFGNTIAVALARDGWAKKLFDGIRRISGAQGSSSSELESFFVDWRSQVAEVLKTNPDGVLSRRQPKLAADFEDSTDFPDMKVVDFYLNPIVSDPTAEDYSAPNWSRRLDTARIVAFSSRMFHWGNVELEAKLCRVMWRGLAMRQMRQGALAKGSETDLDPPSHVLPPGFIACVTDRKCGASTDFVSAWRVEFAADVFDAHVRSVLPATDPHPFPDLDRMSEEERQKVVVQRQAEGKPTKPPSAPTTSDYRHWIPASIVEACEEGREAVEAYRRAVEKKRLAKEADEERKRERQRVRASPTKKKAPSRSPRKARQEARDSTDDEDDMSDYHSYLQRLERERAQKVREEMLARQRREKAKAATGNIFSAAWTAGATSTRLRAPAATKAGSSQPLLASSSLGTSSKPRSREAPFAKPDAWSLTTPPATGGSGSSQARAESSARRCATLIISSDSEASSPDRHHISKTNRPSKVTTSPRKARQAPPVDVLEISSDSSFEGDLGSWLARQNALEKKKAKV